jgi:hypothetical protein
MFRTILELVAHELMQSQFKCKGCYHGFCANVPPVYHECFTKIQVDPLHGDKLGPDSSPGCKSQRGGGPTVDICTSSADLTGDIGTNTDSEDSCRYLLSIIIINEV